MISPAKGFSRQLTGAIGGRAGTFIGHNGGVVAVDGFILDSGQDADGAEEDETFDIHQAHRFQEVHRPGRHNIKGYLRHPVKVGDLQGGRQVCDLVDLVFLDRSEQLRPILNSSLLVDDVRLIGRHHPLQVTSGRGAYVVVDHLVTPFKEMLRQMASNKT